MTTRRGVVWPEITSYFTRRDTEAAVSPVASGELKGANDGFQECSMNDTPVKVIFEYRDEIRALIDPVEIQKLFQADFSNASFCESHGMNAFKDLKLNWMITKKN